MSVKILFDGKEVGTIEADLHQITRESRQKKSAGVSRGNVIGVTSNRKGEVYDEKTGFDFEPSWSNFEKLIGVVNIDKEIKIWIGGTILCSFDKKDVVDIVGLSGGGSRIEFADGSWYELDKTVEYMKEILGVEGKS
ncbi:MULTISPECIES: hypothetical protein [Bacillus amyloliquefaciens group]|uniref:hypothetical protein n=1 Tax=Bacillus amyloliquefaciens group TaxID=1938374 RepID=UPI001AE8F735|nr:MULTISPECIES: hypothetical protein [Bacillus amyloliquefaciens group]